MNLKSLAKICARASGLALARKGRLCSVCTLLILSTLLFGGVCSAQEVTASIYGVVRDPSGAVVGGATVEALQVSTNITRTTKTESSGAYQIPLLLPGTYTLTVRYTGFKTYRQTGILLEINHHAEIAVSLQLGTEVQQVVVNAAAPVLTTDNATIGKVDDSTTIQMMPLNGRLTITGLMALAPGIQNAGMQDQVPAYGIAPSIGGVYSYNGVGFTLDGNRNEAGNIERGLGEYPPLDGIEEFKVITSNASAEYTNLGQVIVISKGGSNQIHGTLLEFNRNRFSAAQDFFHTSQRLAGYNRNEFGGNVSGPVYFPGIYDGRNRSFFFFNFEDMRLYQPNSASAQVPTVKMRQGNFSEFSQTIYNPLTGVAFPGNIIPTAENPVSAWFQTYYPLPTASGTGVNLYQQWVVPSLVPRWTWRGDHAVSSKTQINGSAMINFMGPYPSSGPVSTFGGMSQVGEHIINSQIALTHTFTPTIVSESRLGYLHQTVFRTPQNFNMNTCAHIPGLPCSQPVDGAPQLSISNIQAMSEAGSHGLDQDISFNENVSIVHGKHLMKIGYMFFHNRDYSVGAGIPQRGKYDFNGQYTALGVKGAGIAYADFYLGYPDYTQLYTPPTYIGISRGNRDTFFFIDQWQLTPKLTANLGIRNEYDFLQPFLNGDAMFIPTLGTLAVFNTPNFTPNTYPKGTDQYLVSKYNIQLASKAGLSSNDIIKYMGGNDLNNWAPRVALAYKVTDKTVVRSGFGVYYQVWNTGFNSAAYTSQMPFFAVYTYTNTAVPTATGAPNPLTPGISMNAPFQATGTVPANPTATLWGKPKTPYTLNWNFSVERELLRDATLRVAYVGYRNNKMFGTADINGPMPSPGVNPQTVRPWNTPYGFSTVNLSNANIFNNTDSELQIGFQKRYSKGLLLSSEYMWSRVLGTASYYSPHNYNDSYGEVTGYRHHSLQMAYVYDLPFGPHQHWLGGSTGVVAKAVGGWSLSGVTAILSGQPFSPSFNSTVTGWPASRPDRVAGAALYPATRTVSQYFNASAFALPAVGSYGNSSYNLLFGPGLQNWDMSLSKSTFIYRERIRLLFRFDAFNAFNHPQFANPSANISATSTVGKITSICSTCEARTISLGAKLIF
jgi:hypothetical protein